MLTSCLLPFLSANTEFLFPPLDGNPIQFFDPTGMWTTLALYVGILIWVCRLHQAFSLARTINQKTRWIRFFLGRTYFDVGRRRIMIKLKIVVSTRADPVE